MKIITLLLSSVLALGLSACATESSHSLGTMDSVCNSQENLVDDSHPRATLILSSSQLGCEILLTDVTLGDRGLLARASVNVQNLTDKDVEFEYKFSWRDREGFPIERGNVWRYHSLIPHEGYRALSVGKSQEAYAITFLVRKVR